VCQLLPALYTGYGVGGFKPNAYQALPSDVAQEGFKVLREVWTSYFKHGFWSFDKMSQPLAKGRVGTRPIFHS
jgi:hypothetical protein